MVVHSAAGGVGILALQLGEADGAGRVIATASSEEKRALALELGADAAVDPRREDLTSALHRGQRRRAGRRRPRDGRRARLRAVRSRRWRRSGGIVAYGIATREQNERAHRPPDAQESRAVVGFWLMHCLERPER